MAKHEHSHDGANGHHDHHGHHHHGAVKNILLAFFLNLGFALIELVGGILTNSTAILSDSLHDFGDAISLGISWYLEKVSAKHSDRKYTYGYARFSVLAAFINSLILVTGAAFVLAETIPRLWNPQQSDARGMLILAIFGVAVNGLAAWRLFKGNTLNERAVALHLLEDVLGWVAIIIGSIVMMFVDIPILDPILSCLIMGYVLFNVAGNLKRSVQIFLQGTPAALNPTKLEHDLGHVEGVKDVHDLHVWTLDGQYHIATMHIVVETGSSLESIETIKANIRSRLSKADVAHATIEVEPEGQDCGYLDCGGPKVEHDHHGHAH